MNNNALVFHTVCPFYTGSFGSGRPLETEKYADLLAKHVEIAETNGINGMIIYNFMTSLDSLVIAQRILDLSDQLTPIVAVSPFHVHPYALARTFASVSYLTGRTMHLNVVKGATRDEQAAVGADGDHYSVHYRQITEFLDIFTSLFRDEKCDFEGEYYRLRGASLQPYLGSGSAPGVFVPGSSSEVAALMPGRATSSLLMAKPLVTQADEIQRLRAGQPDLRQTIIVGIVAGEKDENAWAFARKIYGTRRSDVIDARIFESRSISYQHQSNAALGRESEVFDDVLWCGASRAGIDCPKLVGSYERVAAALANYFEIGVTDIVIDLPASTSEYEHIFRATQLVL
ncbi:MAG: LLM class flavin-dependent oxidoreductase [Propionibacteriaceae bacterium]|jgi:alkanesulfonate monooxygenase SsuD/methylene tetrahydromethanopterin reductase-like flavin-dependent oxidoreductase (luciferase family)|nr:LLM class flavin-dependent oxidoreductase [Propionibacteriaceae bacterium]